VKLFIAGNESPPGLRERIAASAKRREQEKPLQVLAPQHSALSLKNVSGQDAYLRQFIRLLWMRHGVSTAPFDVPTSRTLFGPLMAAIKRILWKLLRYQHDRITFQQNLVNELLIDAAEMQQQMFQGKVDEITKRLEAAEKELKQIR
jgi:hypothetical protein